MKTKETNIVTVLSLLVIIAAFILFMFFWKTSSAVTDSEVQSSSKQSSTASVLSKVEDITSRVNKTSSENKSSDIKNNNESNININVTSATDKPSLDITSTASKNKPDTSSSKVKPTGEESKTSAQKPLKSSKNKSLFIGDSRTVGLMEYGGIKNSDFFCWVGMSVYNINKKSVSVPGVGKVSLTELLNGKKYDNIYIMLGINEIGYKLSSIVDKYSQLINSIEESQPNANIFVEANLHVTEKYEKNDKTVNNKAINKLNSKLENLADGKGEFYIDANVLFDDKNGNLSAEKSGDGAHIYAKYYKEWGNWIMEQTALLIGE